MTPALFAFAMTNYGVNTAFQLAHRLTPLIVAALIALLADLVAVALLPATADATRFAYAQSISSVAGFAALVAMLFLLEPMWPRARDVIGAVIATSAMLLLGAPMRAMAPGVIYPCDANSRWRRCLWRRRLCVRHRRSAQRHLAERPEAAAGKKRRGALIAPARGAGRNDCARDPEARSRLPRNRPKRRSRARGRAIWQDWPEIPAREVQGRNQPKRFPA